MNGSAVLPVPELTQAQPEVDPTKVRSMSDLTTIGAWLPPVRLAANPGVNIIPDTSTNVIMVTANVGFPLRRIFKVNAGLAESLFNR